MDVVEMRYDEVDFWIANRGNESAAAGLLDSTTLGPDFFRL